MQIALFPGSSLGMCRHQGWESTLVQEIILVWKWYKTTLLDNWVIPTEPDPACT